VRSSPASTGLIRVLSPQPIVCSPGHPGR
jgi:hypothetical protein